jgi:hypothetical protein
MKTEFPGEVPEKTSLTSRRSARRFPFGASLMLGSDRSRGYCLEMICADFLAGANLDHGDPDMLLFSMTRFFKFLPAEQRRVFLKGLTENAS